MLEVEGLRLGERVVDDACTSCMVQHTPVWSQVDILTCVKTSITKDVVKREILKRERGRGREGGGGERRKGQG